MRENYQRPHLLFSRYIHNIFKLDSPHDFNSGQKMVVFDSCYSIIVHCLASSHNFSKLWRNFVNLLPLCNSPYHHFNDIVFFNTFIYEGFKGSPGFCYRVGFALDMGFTNKQIA